MVSKLFQVTITVTTHYTYEVEADTISKACEHAKALQLADGGNPVETYQSGMTFTCTEITP